MSTFTNTRATSEPVLVSMSVLAGLQFFFIGGAGVSIVSGSPLIAGIFAVGGLGVAAAQTGIQFYVRGQVTPNQKVAVQVADDGTLTPGQGARNGNAPTDLDQALATGLAAAAEDEHTGSLPSAEHTVRNRMGEPIPVDPSLAHGPDDDPPDQGAPIGAR